MSRPKSRGSGRAGTVSANDRFPAQLTDHGGYAGERLADMRKAGDHYRADLATALEVIEWMGGSADFAPGGRARRGWLRFAAPLLEAYGLRLKR